MSENKSFFQTLPGILTGVAALLSAGTGICIALKDDQSGGGPDQETIELSIDAFTFNPMPPVQNKPVTVTASVRNSGSTDAGQVLIKWWPGVNFPDPLAKTIPIIRAGSTSTVVFDYPGYKSWYSRIESKITVNPNMSIVERTYDNNTLKKKISVWKARD